MPARNVGVNSTFEEQRQVINALANDIFSGIGIGGDSSVLNINTSGTIAASGISAGIITTTSLRSTNINATGIITSGSLNVSGNITSGTLNTGNINSTGNLTSVSINSGNINSTGVITATAFYGDGSNLSNIKATEGNTYYVTAEGNDSNPGDSLGSSFLTLNHALSVAVSGDTVRVGSGTFTEIFPLTVPSGVTVRGQGLRATFIQPTSGTKQNDCFLLNGETTVEDLTIGNFFEPGVGFKFANNTKTIIRSPYIQRVTVLNKGSATSTSDPYGFDTPHNPPTYYKAGRGVLIDGSVVDPTTLEPAMLFNECTFITPNNIALEMTNGARTEWVNCFTYFADKGIYAHDGTVGLGSTGYVRIKTSGFSGTTPQVNDELYYLETNSVSGTYSQVGTALTITRVGHGLTVGDRIYADFTSGTATDGYYLVSQYVGINTFTITMGGSATTSGNVSYKEALGFGTIRNYDVSSGLSSISGKGEGLFELPSSRITKTVTPYGNTSLSTSQSKFGTASLSVDGVDDYAVIQDSSDFDFGTGDFTVEFWIRPTSIGSQQVVLDSRTSSGDTAIYLEINSAGNVRFFTAGGYRLTSSVAVTANNWSHIALSRSNGVTRIFVNGTLTPTTYTDANNYTNRSFKIGRNFSGSVFYGGYIDELRISNIARYTASFTVASAAFNSDGYDKILLHFDGINGSTSFIDSSIPSQDIRWVRSGITTATANKITLADYQQFGAEMRSIGSAVVFGNTGVSADGPGVGLRLFAFNFGHIGSGKDFSQDVSLVVQENEVVKQNNANVYFVSIDQSGDFRVGDAFYVNQEQGTVNFGGQNFTLNSLSDLNITDGTNTTTITPTTATVGNVQLSANQVTTTSGDLVVNPSGISSTRIEGDLTVTGVLNLGYSLLGGLDGDKGDITVSSNFSSWTIDNNAVSFGKIQNINTAKVLGRSAVGVGNVEELSTTGTGNVVLSSNPNLSFINVSGISTLAALNVGTGGTVLISTGNSIGIGTINPQYSLDVLGDINFSGTFRQNGSQFVASRWTSGIGDDIYKLNGNVGIGTTNPTSKLSVFGDGNFVGVITSTQFSTGTSGTGININTNTISGPAEITIDPAGVGDNTGAVRIRGDLYIDGTQTYINSTTIELADFNVGIATTVGTNVLLNGAGIGIGSANIRKTITWDNISSSLFSSENFNVNDTKTYKINGSNVFENKTTLGNAVVSSSLTSVGTLSKLNVSGITTLGVTTFTGTVSFGTSAYFGDNDTLNFGDGNDLQIYHDGSNSYVADYGTGKLVLASNGAGVDIIKAPFENIAKFNTDGAVELYYDNTKEFETTGYGATVYGILQSQGLQVSGVSTFINEPILVGSATSTGTSDQKLQVTGNTYVSGNLGVGITNPAAGYKLDVNGSAVVRGSMVLAANPSGTGYANTTADPPSMIAQTMGASDYWKLYGESPNGVNTGYMVFEVSDDVDNSERFIFRTRRTISAVGVGGTSLFELTQNGNIMQYVPLIVGSAASTGTQSQPLQVTGGTYISGNVGIGTTNPTAKLEVQGDLNGTAFESYELDDISTSANGVENTFTPTFDYQTVTITNPFKLMITVNGILQSAFINNTDCVFQSHFLGANNGYTIDYDNKIKFTESIPTGSDVIMRVLPVSNTLTKIRRYKPFSPADILLGY